jgi:hypothetical protein
LPKFDELQGRFAGILPPREPKDNDAQMARFVLAGIDYIVEGKGTSPKQRTVKAEKSVFIFSLYI